ncbi:hypothetical protein E2C01_008780 [Portunus trituberculatus]|uniref:Uncharacterized protein n=1 Tax=Portunus trituberculatus TaxID=210409 RepID=A0A5B7D4R7_PORTR|nr:hypothetical protein [Portunus trituberculatus]
MRRLINVERELRYVKEVISSLMDKQDQLLMENTALKLRVAECEKVSAINQKLKEEILEIKKQNGVLKTTCQNYESSLKSLQAKVQGAPPELKFYDAPVPTNVSPSQICYK